MMAGASSETASRRKTLARETSSNMPVARLMRLPREGRAAPRNLTVVPALLTRTLTIGRRPQFGQHGADQLTQRTPRILALHPAALRQRRGQCDLPRSRQQGRREDRPWRCRPQSAAPTRAVRQHHWKAARAVRERHDGARDARQGGEDRPPRNRRLITALAGSAGSHARRHGRRGTTFTAFKSEPHRLRQPARAYGQPRRTVLHYQPSLMTRRNAVFALRSAINRRFASLLWHTRR
jgi:hypothetical protein